MSNVTTPNMAVMAIDSIFCVGLSMFGLFGNLCVLLVLYKLDFSPTNFLIFNLVVFDVVTCFCAVIKQVLHINGEPLGHACITLQYALYVSTAGVPFFLLAIAIDRYRRVCQVYRWQISFKHTKIILVAILLISALISIPILYIYKPLDPLQRNVECVVQIRNTYSLIYFIFLFVLLLILTIPIIFCYRRVCQVIEEIKFKREHNAAQVQRATETMSCIAVVFLLSYFPCLLVDVLDQKIESNQHLVVQILSCLATRSYLIICLFNPILYGFRDKRSRLVFKAIFDTKPISSEPEPPPQSWPQSWPEPKLEPELSLESGPISPSA